MDDQTFAAMVERAQTGLLALAWALTTDNEDALDLVQDTILRAYTKRRLLAGAHSPYAYLRAIMLNLWRSQPSRPKEAPLTSCPEQAVEDHHGLARAGLARALRELSPQQRAIVALRYIEDVSVLETARFLRCSPDTVTTQSARALKRLRSIDALTDLLED